MNHLERSKTVVGTGVTASAATATLSLDTLGFAYASIDVVIAKSSTGSHSASSALTTLTLKHGETTAGTTTVYSVTLPSANTAVTAQATVVRLDVDLRAGYGRYLKIDATPAFDLRTDIVARLGKGVGPVSTAAEKGTIGATSG